MSGVEYVFVYDGVCLFVMNKVICDVLIVVEKYGVFICVVLVKDIVKKVE